MSLFTKFIVILLTLGFVYYNVKVNKITPIPTIQENWWGEGSSNNNDDSTIRPFEIKVSIEVINDLNRRLNNTLPFQPSLEGVNQNYGIHSELLNTIIDYWKNEYNWEDRQIFLNGYPQFQTVIQGIKIHFVYVRPENVPEGVEVIPLLLIHGWPSSFREFYEMIPVLITPQKGKNFVFEVVVPSLPGYGFSDAPVRPGLGPAQIAQLFDRLMQRLDFNKYYVQGGDWGSLISHSLAVFYPQNVIGVHRNWCFTNLFFNWKSYVAAYFPSLFYSDKEIERILPMNEKLSVLLLESGYFHIQATKPDTVGVALRESPAGLAAYIIEKFITWTNPSWKDLPDGGLTIKYTLDKLLDNVMIYWVTRSITTSVRLYAEKYSKEYLSLNIDNLPIRIPAGCNRFRHEITYSPEIFLKESHTNLIHLTDYEDGGHFAAFENPEILGRDIIDFVDKVRKLARKNSNTEL